MKAPNPDTHCPTCGEPLSEFGHCWQHHYPPMDPAQDKQPSAILGQSTLLQSVDKVEWPL